MKKKKKKARAGKRRSSPPSKVQPSQDITAMLVLPEHKPTSPTKKTKLSDKINFQLTIKSFVEFMNSAKEFIKFLKIIGQGYEIYLYIVGLWKLIPSWPGKHWIVVMLSWFS